MIITNKHVAHSEAHNSTSPEEELLRLAAHLAAGQPLTAPPVVSPSSEELTGERIRELLERILVAQRADEALQWLHETGLLVLILPEVAATVDFAEEMERQHKDVWKHTKQVVQQAPAELAVRWAALLHDIGKVPTREITPDGKVTFHGHPEVGARMFDRIARRLAFPEPLRQIVRFLILHHLRANQYEGNWTDAAVRRFSREMGEHLPALLLLSRADITSAKRHKREAALTKIDELAARIEALREIDSRRPPLPSGLGNHIMEHFGLPPGRLIGELRGELEQAIAAGELEPYREPDYYLEYLSRRGVARE